MENRIVKLLLNISKKALLKLLL